MVDKTKCDFSGWATKIGIRCSDGRTIQKDAFKENDGMIVPLVWGHDHDSVSSVLGHVLLENRDEGVYAYGFFNDTDSGRDAKLSVQHRDLTSLSIWANELVEKSKSVVHGVIKEVSLVLAGANRGALIDYFAMAHSEEDVDFSDEEAIIYTGLEIELAHADSGGDKTVKEVLETLTEEQATAVYALVADIMEGSSTGDTTAQHSDEGEEVMKENVFDQSTAKGNSRQTLTHAQFAEILADAKAGAGWKRSFLAHVQTYGIENIEYLFPDSRELNAEPSLIKRDMAWVDNFLNGANHLPFARVKTTHADITLDEARARGYVTGALKTEEFFTLLRRSTDPTTVYVKQKLDNDDIIDITDMNVVAFMQRVMRIGMNEELARAGLFGDGRAADSPDKIKADKVRPIWTDADLYSIKVALEAGLTVEETVDAIAASQEDYRGSGNLVMYTTMGFMNKMLLKRDTLGHRLYANKGELANELNVSQIVTVPLMKNLSRTVNNQVLNLRAILVDPRDYAYGADKGGALASYEQFDIDFNQHKYLLETRCSAALTEPYSALVIEEEAA